MLLAMAGEFPLCNLLKAAKKGPESEKDGHAHVSACFCTETTTKPPAKIRQVSFKSVSQVWYIQPISPIHPHYFGHVNHS